MNLRALSLPILSLALALPASAQTPVRKMDEPMTAAKLASIPSFVLPEKYRDRVANPLPKAVDNTKQKYMPPYRWEIQGSSCANAAAVSYAYSYAAQAQQNIATAGTAPHYTYEYTYHFLNGGDDNGDAWMFVEAFDILKETGAPTSADFGGFEWGNAFNGWMSGYDKYHRAMKQRVEQYYKIDAKTAAADELIKQYLYDRADGSPYGGLLVFQAGLWEEQEVGDRLLFYELDGWGHSIPILGYDDAFQGGSYLVTDNFGTGLAWVPYKEFRTGGRVASENGSWVMFPKVRKDYAPKLAFKITMTHDQRGKIAVLTGVAGSASAAAPAKVKDYAGAFNFSGGNFPMAGKNRSQTLEFGLDLTDLLAHAPGPEARFFLQVVSKGGAGRIDKVSLMDYTSGEPREIAAAEVNKVIAPNATTTVSVPWSGAATGLRPDLATRVRPAVPNTTLRLRDVRGRSVAGKLPWAVLVGPGGKRPALR